jgi:phthiocerol/phenolphthiocerol synthesis type-I polyketide synthase E
VRLAFLFPGLGAQHAGMGSGLYEREPAFRAAVDECGGLPAGDLADPETAVPALFVTEYALVRLWQAYGIEPDALLGHSIGEHVAALVAGVFTLPDALTVVRARGRLLQATPPGAMLAVRLAESEALARLPDGVSPAAVNGPGNTVLAGPADALERLAGALAAEGIGSRRVQATRAYHSVLMEPVLPAFRAVLDGVRLTPPDRPMLSNVTGDWLTAEQATDPGYWVRHLRGTVRFGDCVRRVLDHTLVECGPGHPEGKNAPFRPLQSLPDPGEPEVFHETLAALRGQLLV